MILERTACNLCGYNDAKELFSRYDALTEIPEKFPVVKCQGCGLVYVNPRPAPAEMPHFYTREFISYQFDVTPTQAAHWRERLVSWMTQSSAEMKIKNISSLLKLYQKPHVLDIGCGKGSFLHALKNKFNTNVCGIDFDQESVDYCQHVLGIDVYLGNIATLENLDKNFDVITMWHFLEHEYNPLNTLKSLHRILRSTGRLVIEVPNAESLENRVFGSRSYLYDVPRHLYDFSPDTISQLLVKSGFEVSEIRFSPLSGGWIGSVQSFFLRGRIYKHLNDHILLFLAFIPLLFPIDALANLLGKGSIMTIVARRT